MLEHVSKSTLLLVCILGGLLAPVLAGGMIVLAGGPSYLAGELAGIIFFFELFYYALAAAVAGVREMIRRRQTRGVSMQEKINDLADNLAAARERNRQRNESVEARLAAARERNRKRGELIKSGICPACRKQMTLVQRGGLVVASPCNHVMYEGRLKK